MGVSRLGKKYHSVIRDDKSGGEWVDGEWIAAGRKRIKIFANIQPAWSFSQTQLLPSGDRDKRKIWFSSDHWVYEASHGEDPLEADIIEYNGAKWEVKAVMPYGNFGEHCEGIAVLMDDSQRQRIEGLIHDI